MVAFVTGGTGFVGAYLLRRLLDDPQYTTIRAIRRASSSMDLVADIADKIAWHEGDILDTFSLEDAMQGADHVYHAAAHISFVPKEREKMLKINIEGTANVVNTALYCQIKRFGYISSIAALGRNKDTPLIDENNKWQADPLNSNYAISKFYAEQEVWRGAAEGLSVVIVNPSIILGSGDWRSSSPSLFQQIATGLKFFPVGKTGFIDVRDVAKALHLAVNTASVEGERFVLNSENWSYQRLFNAMADALNTQRPSIAVSPLIRELAWRAYWLIGFITGKKGIVSREPLLNSSHDFEYLNNKFLTQFPDYQFISIEKSIAESVSVYKTGRIARLTF
jgi:nucleoside-diphosphate-sugar epimerase